MTIPAEAVSAAAVAFWTSTSGIAYERMEQALAAAAPAMRLQAMAATAEALDSCGFTDAASLVRSGAERTRGDFEQARR